MFDTEINYEDSDADFDDEVFAEDLYADAAEAELQMAGNYSPDKAVAYADKYWENYNPAYHNYNPDGGDCANFTSQCLYAGGLQMDSKWKASGTPLRGSVAWINATGLKNYLSENVGKSFDSQSADHILRIGLYLLQCQHCFWVFESYPCQGAVIRAVYPVMQPGYPGSFIRSGYEGCFCLHGSLIMI